MRGIRNAPWHTLIVDESTDIAVHKEYCTVLEEYCRVPSSENGDPEAKHCYKKRNDLKYRVTLTALGDVLGELAQLYLSLQKRNLTVMEGHCFGRAKIEKPCSQYLNEEAQWSDCVREVMRATKADGAITRDITQFISKLCEHLDACFPVDGLNQCSAFDIEALCSDVSFEYGSTKIATLAKKPFSAHNL